MTIDATNSPATGAPTITGTVRVGETLTANTSGVADADGLGSVQYEYQWLADDAEIAGATGSTYTLVDADEGKAITVRVSFTDDDDNEETLTSGATDSVSAAPTPNSPATGVPTISGTAQVGQTLTADTSGIADADGLSNVQYEYQWLADDSEIAGATGSAYTLVAADEGKVVKVRVRFADDAGNAETLTSAATEASLGSEDVVAWSAIMTVETVDHGYGYSTYARNAGSLSPASFNVGRHDVHREYGRNVGVDVHRRGPGASLRLRAGVGRGCGSIPTMRPSRPTPTATSTGGRERP